MSMNAETDWIIAMKMQIARILKAHFLVLVKMVTVAMVLIAQVIQFVLSIYCQLQTALKQCMTSLNFLIVSDDFTVCKILF